jgi:hypothetical protein
MIYNQNRGFGTTALWEKFVHGEIEQFFLLLLIFPVFSTVLGVFHLKRRILAQHRTTSCNNIFKSPKPVVS